MTKYAAGTQVPPSQSLSEIEATLDRYGATGFAYAKKPLEVVIGFELSNYQFRIVMPLPDRKDFEYTGSGQWRSNAEQESAHRKAIMQRWRALALVIKAKLEAAESGISTIEREFLSDLVLPSGSTVGDWVTSEQIISPVAALNPPAD